MKIFDFNKSLKRISYPNHLNEMAFNRDFFKWRFEGFSNQIIENWILIHYCSLSNSHEYLKKHWASELSNKFLIPLNQQKIKKSKKIEEIKLSIIYQYWFDGLEYDKSPESIRNILLSKLEDENIDIDDDIRKCIVDLMDYGFEDIAYQIAYGDEKSIREYCYHEI